MKDTAIERGFVLFFRFALAWVFLYAASHQVGNPDFTVARFLANTKTFHDVYIPLTAPSIAPTITFLVSYGHLIIGLSLLSGLMVRVSSALGATLMMVYWTAHMNFPYITSTTNFLVDEHVVYAAMLVFLGYKHAGHVFGLDALVNKLGLAERLPILRPLTA